MKDLGIVAKPLLRRGLGVSECHSGSAAAESGIQGCAGRQDESPDDTEEEEMKCVICHGEDVQLKDVNEELKINSDVVLVPIRVLVCQACGERYFSRQAMQFLESAETELRGSKAKLRQIGKVLAYQ